MRRLRFRLASVLAVLAELVAPDLTADERDAVYARLSAYEDAAWSEPTPIGPRPGAPSSILSVVRPFDWQSS